MSFTRILPETSCRTRQRLYDGEIFLIDSNDLTRSFVVEVVDNIKSELGNDYRLAHEQFSDTELFERVGRLRKLIYTSTAYHSKVNQIIGSLGFDLEQEVFDPARIRVVGHLGHNNPAAKPIYHGHRDT